MKKRPHRRQSGSALIESIVSLLIFSVGLIALVGLAGRAMNQATQSKARNDASYLAGELIGDMWVSASTPAAYDTTAWTARVNSALPCGGGALVCANGTQVDIDIWWIDKKKSDNSGVNCGSTTLCGPSTCGAISSFVPAEECHHYITSAQIAKNS